MEPVTRAEAAIIVEAARIAEDPTVGELLAVEETLAVSTEPAADPSGMQKDDFWGQEIGKPFFWFRLKQSHIRLRVSSRHLSLASPYFKVALNGPWREAASTSTDGSHSIYADDWDSEAFLILMHIIHGRNRQVPRRVSLELLAKISVLIDYYECHEAVELFSELWLRELKSQLPAQPGRELTLWLCVSWILGAADIFASTTSIALRQSQGPLATLGLPIPERIVGKQA